MREPPGPGALPTVNEPTLGDTTGATPLPVARAPWSLAQKLGFRFALLYVAIYIFPFPFMHVGGLDRLAAWGLEQHERFVHALGIQLLDLPAARPPVGGCGDRADHYLGVPVDAAFALAAAALWSWLDRRRNDHHRLAYWAAACLRYYVAHTMLQYGVIKIFKSQFLVPSPSQLLSPLGELSPMGLLWAFMGVSTGYCMFIGLCEALGGLLLFFRRTALAGALLGAGVLTNVFLLNVFYGVCVKLFSAHLLLLTVLLLIPEARRLRDALLLGRAVPARDLARPSYGARTARAFTIIKLVVVPGLIALCLRYGYGAWHAYGDAAPLPPFHGVWDVDLFAPSGQPAPSGAPNAWRSLAIDATPYATLRPQSGKARSIGLRVDTEARLIRLRLDPNADATLAVPYTTPAPDLLELDVPLEGAATHVRLKRRPRIPLISSPFRWTSDLP